MEGYLVLTFLFLIFSYRLYQCEVNSRKSSSSSSLLDAFEGSILTSKDKLSKFNNFKLLFPTHGNEVFLEMNGGRQQNIRLSESVNNIKTSTREQIHDYSKKIYEVTDKENKKHQELLDFINNF